MPKRAGHACRPGCPNIVPAGERHCPGCTKDVSRQVEHRRGSRASRGYGPEWDRTRAVWLRTVWPGLGRQPMLCGDRIDGTSGEHSRCVREGRATPTALVDHILRRKAGGTDADTNLQLLCDQCHNVKRQQEGRDR
jgi:5-methylcytosine-specific restriction protein A